ncbi:MAG: hypothetical protein EOR30_29560 [Mesorhizobium sp.]|nr:MULTISPECIES: Spy/CpxP family protein refolding chaperone [unclassified Mesorhizobium]RUV74873.1 hypothetical protein EOA78_07725 [Mesorhizobium sp. M5C.F.Cr.IN.023.01.1.1]RWF88688.1 MAG: hypothetical protein EOQ36_07640 [Mesorhizobium sp.]RWF92965.1 MAG: hypothetical protein EOQ45_19090 [Mesorhizobium sp.]RWI41243.1 MAG: hypothetical protein EOR14_09220 [Mesorhizobium sp.]RWI49829.1 MAG: hypothetical protein EOR15_12160 [Mesorhizobium sp.]
MSTLYRSMAMAAMLVLTVPALANEAHHTTEGASETPPAATSEQPKGADAGPATGSMMMGGPTPNNMMSNGMMPDGMMKMMMDMMAGGGGPMGQMMSPEHVEGRIAFLATELKLTEAQQPLWEAVAEALRANARAAKAMMAGMPAAMMMSMNSADGTPVERIELHEKMLSARLEGLRRLKAALEPFYASLNDTQKALADKLLMPAPMCMT